MKKDKDPQNHIIVKSGLLDNIGTYISGKRVFVVADETVFSLYGERLEAALLPREVNVYQIPDGEDSKKMETVMGIIEAMLVWGMTRTDELIAFGGGVVGDVAGFCAAIYMRGIAYYQIPTTLLAQVDSSVGGKTAINMPQGKNLVGAFYQAKYVLIDPELLKTLPRRQVVSGLGEVVKYGMILDADFLASLSKNLNRIFSMDTDYLEYAVNRCVTLKRSVTDVDEREQGLRKILNFGHTVGHGIEKVLGYGFCTHGEAVLWGMAIEAGMALDQDLIDRVYYEEILDLIRQCAYTHMPELSMQAIAAAIHHDKKNRDGGISFILPVERGKVKEFLFAPTEAEAILERSFVSL